MTKERDDIGELGDDAKAILRSAQAGGWDAPPSGAKERVRSALAIALAGTATAAAGSALGASTAKAAVAAKAATAATTGAGSAGASTAAVGAAVGAASATAGAAGAAGSVAGAGLFSGLAAKVAIAALAVSAVGGTIALTRPPSEAPRPVPVASSSAHDEGAPAAERAAPAVVVPEPEAVLEPAGETITETVEVAPAEAARAPRVERAAPSAIAEAMPEEAAPPSTLEDENAVLDRLHVAQAHGDVEAVLGIIAEHRARFPRGRLSEEFSAAEVRTLCRSHDPRAPELRAAFEERYPRSLFLPSIGTACR